MLLTVNSGVADKVNDTTDALDVIRNNTELLYIGLTGELLHNVGIIGSGFDSHDELQTELDLIDSTLLKISDASWIFLLDSETQYNYLGQLDNIRFDLEMLLGSLRGSPIEAFNILDTPLSPIEQFNAEIDDCLKLLEDIFLHFYTWYE